jgi:regulator of sigma E protease
VTILIFLAVLFVLVLVHELGHFVVAKLCGMRVDEFGIGFPPKLFGIRRGETEYTLNLFPIGGFVKILGENPVEAAELGEEPRAFGSKRAWAQAAVLVAGVTMNILLAWALFTAVFLTGVPTIVDESEADPDARLVIADVLPDSPAAVAGLPIGATVTDLSAGGDTLTDHTPLSFAMFLRAHGTEPVTVGYTLGGSETIERVTITPAAGVIESATNQPAIGVAVSLVESVQYSLLDALREATVTTFTSLWAIIVGIAGLIGSVATFSADLSHVSGPVGIVGMVGDAAHFGFASLLMFAAFISLNLAVINLVPVPALDGGRLLFVVIETIMRRPLNPVWAGRANMIGFSLLILLMVAVTIHDVLRVV